MKGHRAREGKGEREGNVARGGNRLGGIALQAISVAWGGQWSVGGGRAV